MFKQLSLSSLCLLAVVSTTQAQAGEFMDAAWAKQACDAWNTDATLTAGLMDTDGYSWIKNDAGRGYKLIQMYRTSCGEASKVQLNISLQGNKAMCNYGGATDGKAMNFDVDYLMHAKDTDWTCMGNGDFGCGAMGAMMSGKLNFKGPKMEAMKVMSPFESFLKLTGKVPGNKTECKTQ
ncbi:MAG TPA: SCP2 sterol-binding domain-containing protein [Candidatus Thiothrix moscowensis]|mgnify:CR=1 FL=1|uniref:SCP2 sterol-binding domain-containing protein n=1 Tax=unclassified Thiothrix TaxID=2636184 RepID=UPI0025DEA9C6|nr:MULTISPECIES: SCP2 sterol-binding domain-containing protein [unclassified Thiothrix]HRJ53734.1 SCP2 sterol-binding domain-containing protein [Candidatus Thiothrix moscowensis]HRJ93816.1 SCP2 sterol-binding domain-containing protein [Candidatus Thiothrix moscowensis]